GGGEAAQAVVTVIDRGQAEYPGAGARSCHGTPSFLARPHRMPERMRSACRAGPGNRSAERRANGQAPAEDPRMPGTFRVGCGSRRGGGEGGESDTSAPTEGLL